MTKLKIMALHQTTPDKKSILTSFFDNLLPVLRKKFDIQMMWLVYTPDRLESHLSNDIILDIHNYKNALTLLEKEKPDLIFATANPTFIDYSVSLAAKYLKIPVVSGFSGRKFNEMTRSRLITSYFTRIFQTSVPTDTEKNKKQFFRRGRFVIYKYFFLLKTQSSLKFSIFKIFQNFMMLVKVFLTPTDFLVDPKFSNTIHWVDGHFYYDLAIKSGFDESSLVMTGDPVYDLAFKKISQSPSNKKISSNKINVLLITSAMYEHGIWTKKQRDTIIKEIVQIISNSDTNFSLTIKIHPSSENFLDYKSLLNEINSDVSLFQNGDILDFLSEADVVIGFLTHSALEYALIFKKPIIICNFYNLIDDVFLEKELALECKNPLNLVSLITNSITSNLATEKKVSDYTKEYLYKSDGLASERLCTVIEKLIKPN
jgi:hypothetical protein